MVTSNKIQEKNSQRYRPQRNKEPVFNIGLTNYSVYVMFIFWFYKNRVKVKSLERKSIKTISPQYSLLYLDIWNSSLKPFFAIFLLNVLINSLPHLPATLLNIPVLIFVYSFSILKICTPFTLPGPSIAEVIYSFPFAKSFNEWPFIFCCLIIDHGSSSMANSIFPFPSILTPVNMLKNTIAVKVTI